MRIYPAVHYTMGGLWVDYDLESSIPGLYVAGEANFSDHGANRLGASALMQGLSDGYFVIPATLPAYLTTTKPGAVTTAAVAPSAGGSLLACLAIILAMVNLVGGFAVTGRMLKMFNNKDRSEEKS